MSNSRPTISELANESTDFTLSVANAVDELIMKAIEHAHPSLTSSIYYYTVLAVVANMFIRLEPNDEDLSLDARLTLFKKEVMEFIEDYKTEEHKQ